MDGLLDEPNLERRASKAHAAGWTLNSGGIPIPPPDRSGSLTQEQVAFVARLGQKPLEEGGKVWCEHLLAALLRSDEGAAIIGGQRTSPVPGYGSVCPADFDDPSHDLLLSAGVQLLKRKEKAVALSRTELEAMLKEAVAISVGHEEAMALRLGPDLHDLLGRLFDNAVPDLGPFLHVLPSNIRERKNRERPVPARARSPLEKWLVKRRVVQIERRHPDREGEDGYMEEIAHLATLTVGGGKKAVLFDLETPPSKSQPTLWLGQAVIGKPGNLVALQGLVKTGKSAAIEGLIASTMASTDADCLGFRSNNESALAVLHFDTEQDREDHHDSMLRAIRRAGSSKPEWLRSFWIRELGIKERLAFIRDSMASAKQEFDGLYLVLVDGVADLCSNVNDPEEALAVVHELLRLSSEYQTVVVCVLHENPGTEIGKTRGHLGSELERKAMSNLRLQKDSEGVVTIFGEKMRKCEIPKSKGVRFRWDEDAKMHLTVTEVANNKIASRRWRSLALAILTDTKVLPYGEILAQISAAENVEARAAKDRFAALKREEMIVKNGDRKGSGWRLGPNAICPGRMEVALRALVGHGQPAELAAWFLILPQDEAFSEVELASVAEHLATAGRALREPDGRWHPL